MTASNRVYGLDILRALAILFVIYSHSFFLIIDHVDERLYNLLSLDGVTLFFVLSGFLIGGILLKIINTTSFSMGDLYHFWIRRWFRTLPNYFFMILLLILLAFLRGADKPDHLVSYFFFVQNFFAPHPAFFPEAWSLSVEEWFYLLIPLGLFLSLRFLSYQRKNIVLSWIVGTILLITMLRILRAVFMDIQDFGSWDNLQRKLVITRLDSIMFGFFGAWMSCYHKAGWLQWKKPLLIAGMLLLFIPVAAESLAGKNLVYLNYLSLTVTSAATLMMLPALSELKHGKGIAFRFLTFVSIISYSMYLVNFSLVQLTIIPSLTNTIVLFTNNHLVISIIRYILYWALTFGLSYLLYQFFERPVMNLRERFGRGRIRGTRI